jgi:hypothetical protein
MINVPSLLALPVLAKLQVAKVTCSAYAVLFARRKLPTF